MYNEVTKVTQHFINKITPILLYTLVLPYTYFIIFLGNEKKNLFYKLGNFWGTFHEIIRCVYTSIYAIYIVYYIGFLHFVKVFKKKGEVDE